MSSFVTDAPTVVEAICRHVLQRHLPAWCGGSASSSSSSNNGVLASPLSPSRVAFIGNQMQARLLDYGGGVDGVDGGSGDEDNYGSAVRRGIAALEELRGRLNVVSGALRQSADGAVQTSSGAAESAAAGAGCSGTRTCRSR